MRRRRTAILAGGAALTLAALLCGLLWFVATPTGGELLARLLTKATIGKAPFAVTVQGLDLDLSGTVRAGRVALADAEGPWLVADDILVETSPAAILAGRLEVPLATAARIRLERLPGNDPHPAPALPGQAPRTNSGHALPPLPALRLDSLSVARLELGAGAVGMERAYAVTASAQTGPSGIRAAARAEGRDDASEMLELDADLDLLRGTITLRAKADDPAGILARLASLPDGPARMNLDVSGPLATLTGRIDAEMTGAGTLRAELSAQAAPAPEMRLRGHVALRPGLLPGPLERIFGQEAELDATAALDGAAELLRIKALTLALAADTATFDGSYHWPTGETRWQAKAGPGLVALAAREAGVELLRPQALRAQGEGPLTDMRVKAEAAAAHARLNPADLTDPQAVVTATLDLSRATIPDAIAHGSWTAATLLSRPLGPGEISASAAPEGARWAVTDATLTLPDAGAALTGSGTVGRDGAEARLHLALRDLGPLAALPAGAHPSLKLDATASTGGRDGWSSVSANLTGWVEPGPDDRGSLADILGQGATLGGLVTVDGDKATLTGATLKSPTLGLSGAAAWHFAEGGFDAKADALATALTLHSTAGPAVLKGLRTALEARGSGQGFAASATWSLDKAFLPGVALRSGTGSAKAEGPWDILRLTFSATGEALPEFLADASGPGQPALALTLDGNGTWNTRAAGLDAALALTAKGAQGADPRTSPLESLKAEATLAADASGQRAHLEARAAGLRLWSLGADTATLRCDLDNAPTSPTLTGTLRIEGATAGGLRLTEASGNFHGQPQALEFTAKAAGDAGGPLALDMAGGVTLADSGGMLRIDSATGRWSGLPVALRRQARLLWDGAGQRLEGLDAALGKGTLRAEAALAADSVTLDAEAATLPLSPFLKLSGLPLEGDADASLTAGGRADAPDISLRAKGILRVPPQALSGKAPDVAFTVVGGADAHEMRAALSLDAGNGTRLDAEAALPGHLDVQALACIRTPGQVRGRAKGRLDLALAGALLNDEERRLSGSLELDAALAGTFDAPSFTGTARLSDGQYEDTRLGLILDAIEGLAEFKNDALRLRTLTATDGGTGRISATGFWNPAAAPAYSIQAELRGATLLRHRLATTSADGTLRLEDAAPAPTLRGNLVLTETNITIPDALPDTVPDLPVHEVNVPEGLLRNAPSADGEGASQDSALALAVRLGVPGRFHVRGRGLDVEFKGGIDIGGTTARPALDGELSTVRGSYRFLDRVFTIASGRLLFSEASALPDIDVKAATSVPEATVTAVLQGPADKFELTLESDPFLPRDEILSRLLFGRSMASLSPVQAFQLASALRQLSGNGGGLDPVGTLRAFTGLDQLELLQDEENGGMRVGAGKYIHERVYIEVQHDTATGGDDVSVDVELTPDIGVSGNAGRTEGGVGVYWKKDY